MSTSKRKPREQNGGAGPIERTAHGDGIAEQIQGNDAYGNAEPLTLADVWNIVDNLHTHFMDNNHMHNTLALFEKWMRELEKFEPNMEMN